MPVGYSGTPLAKKLGIKPGHRVVTLSAPAEFEVWVDPLPDDVRLMKRMAKTPDVVVAFAKRRIDLERQIERSMDPIFPDGAFWAAWPKKASKVPTDITEDVVREIALPRGLVDVKVCAISEVWSGLRLVWRKELREERV